jgi:hypothetical protein
MLFPVAFDESKAAGCAPAAIGQDCQDYISNSTGGAFNSCILANSFSFIFSKPPLFIEYLVQLRVYHRPGEPSRNDFNYYLKQTWRVIIKLSGELGFVKKGVK